MSAAGDKDSGSKPGTWVKIGSVVRTLVISRLWDTADMDSYAISLRSQRNHAAWHWPMSASTVLSICTYAKLIGYVGGILDTVKVLS